MPDRQRLLELAQKGLEAERTKIDEEISQIKTQLGPLPPAAKSGEARSEPAGAHPRKKRTMSAEARRKISEAMKRRYAEMRRVAKK